MKTRDKFITNVLAFLPKDSEIKDILDMCAFSCDEYDWTVWKDEFGNSLKFEDTKKISCTINSIPHESNITDLYFHSPFSFIFEKSVWMMCALCSNDNVFIALLGKDNRLRILQYNDNNCTNLVPLTLGLTTVRAIVKQIHDSSVKFLAKLPKPIIKMWNMKIPVQQDIIESIKKENIKVMNKILADIA